MKVLLIGSSGVVGSAAASALAGSGCEALAASRSGELTVDATDEQSIRALFEQVGEVDAVVCAAGAVPFKPLAELSRDDFVTGYLGKAQSQIDLVQIGTPYVRDGGSFTLTTASSPANRSAPAWPPPPPTAPSRPSSWPPPANCRAACGSTP